MGPGDFSALLNSDPLMTLSYANNTLVDALTGGYFGRKIDDTDHYANLWYGSEIDNAIIAPNFQGLGLPENAFKLFVSLLSRISQGLAAKLTVYEDTTIKFETSCNDTDLQVLWEYRFAGEIESDNQGIFFPIGSFAHQDQYEEACWIVVKKVPGTTVVLGSMFMQNF